MGYIRILKVLCMFLLIPAMCLAGTYSGGRGIEGDPYKISNTDDWQELVASTEDLSAHFVLTADIDFAEVSNLRPIAPYENAPFVPQFGGTLDGNNHVISDAFINLPNNSFVGLFGYVDSGGVIKNLGLDNISITGGWNVGGLVGYSKGEMSNCYAKGFIEGSSEVGGLVGKNAGNISDSNFIGTVESDYYSGGLVGVNSGSLSVCHSKGTVTCIKDFAGGLAASNRGTVVDCYSTCNVIAGEDRVGGLLGCNSYGSVSRCFATGSVNGGIYNAGGLVGNNINSGSISECYATGTVTGSKWVGGLVGDNSSIITDCYSTGSVTGSGDIVGGLVGENDYYDAVISRCYATGFVSGSGDDIGGLVGLNGNIVIASFWDVLATGQEGSSGGRGLITPQMKTLSIFCNADWGSRNWVMDASDYPRLAWEETGYTVVGQADIPFLGLGTSKNPYQIWTAEEFNFLSWHASVFDKHFLLMTDLDMSGVQLYPIGDLGVFTGVFDGGGHVITNAVIDQPGNRRIGIFGTLGDGGVIRDLSVTNIFVRGNDYVGGLLGYNYDGVVMDCSSSGIVIGDEMRIGGLIGLNFGSINNCHASCSIEGGRDVGGLIGYNIGSIVDCDAMSSITVDGSSSGGLIGNNSGPISNCYALVFLLSSSNYAGGLVGSNSDILSDCFTFGSVSGIDVVGGLVGGGSVGTIVDCFSDCEVQGHSYVGGLKGKSWSKITRSFATGSVTGIGDKVGGLVGENYGGAAISYCYAKGDVRGTSMVGGLVGHQDRSSARIDNCYAVGNVDGDAYLGGLVGDNSECVISCCYAKGVVNGSGDKVGGLVGYSEGHVSSCYSTGLTSGNGENVGGFAGCNFGGFSANLWDIETSGMVVGVGNEEAEFGEVIGKVTSDMQIESTFLDVGWDFTSPAWRVIGQRYPSLMWFSPDIDNNRRINLIDLALISENWLSSDCDMCNKADLTGEGDVDIYDLIVFADNWCKEDHINDHVYKVTISTGHVYGQPYFGASSRLNVDISTDNTVEKIEILTPADKTYIINRSEYTPSYDGGVIVISPPSSWSEKNYGYNFDQGVYDWQLVAGFRFGEDFNSLSVGNYTITLYYANGHQDQTTVWFGVPDTTDSIPQPTERPQLSSFAYGDTVTLPASFAWEACTDDAASSILFDLYRDDTQVFVSELPISATSLSQPFDLEAGAWQLELNYIERYTFENADGINVKVGKYSKGDYPFTVE